MAAARKVVSMYSQMTVPKRRSSLELPCASALATMTNTSTGAMPLQCADEQAAQLADPACTRHRKRQHRADDQTDDDAKDEADLIVLLCNGFCTIHHIKTLLCICASPTHTFLSLSQRQLLL